MLKERERLQVKKNALAFFSSSLESLQAMDKQTWSHHIPQSLSYQVSAGDMCGNLLARFTQNCTDFHRLRRRIHHRLGTIGGMRSHFSWLRVGTLASHRVWLTFFHRFDWLEFSRKTRGIWQERQGGPSGSGHQQDKKSQTPPTVELNVGCKTATAHAAQWQTLIVTHTSHADTRLVWLMNVSPICRLRIFFSPIFVFNWKFKRPAEGSLSRTMQMKLHIWNFSLLFMAAFISIFNCYCRPYKKNTAINLCPICLSF